jgi:AAA family ATP:ADP antiporter
MPAWIRKFIDIRKDEIAPTALFFTFWFIILLVFHVLKPLKKGLFVDALGATTELYAKLGNIGIALLVVVVFTALYNRLGSARMLGALCGIFILALAGFSAVLRGAHPAGPFTWVFYLFGDAWSTVWVTAFWAYLNEMTRTEQSKRLYGIIGGGGVAGGLVGELGVWKLVGPLGAPALLAGCAALTAGIWVLVRRMERIAATPGAAIGRVDQPAARTAPKSNAALEGARIVASSRYLLAITAIVFLYEIVSQVLDYQYSTASEALQGAGATQAFFGQVGTIAGVVSVVTQFLLVSFVIRTFGLTTALLVLPVVMAMASGIYFAIPSLTAAAFLTISDNGLSYSMNQTARETLFVPTEPDVKYKARAFINMFVQRFGKGIAILMALVLSAVPVRYLSLLALGVIAIWALLAAYAGRRFEGLTRAAEAPEPLPAGGGPRLGRTAATNPR